MSKSSVLLTAEICRSDSFLELSFSAQALYLQCCFECDAYGRFSNPKTLLRASGNTKESLSELTSKGFLIELEHNQQLYFVVRSWWCMNKLDRGKFSNPPLVQSENLCTFAGSNEFHTQKEAYERGFVEIKKEENEGLPQIKMFASPELVPTKSPSSPEGDTNSNSNSNSNEQQHNGNITNFSNSNSKNKENKNSPELVPVQSPSSPVCKCPQCGNDATFYEEGNTRLVDCPQCGVLQFDTYTGEFRQ